MSFSEKYNYIEYPFNSGEQPLRAREQIDWKRGRVFFGYKNHSWGLLSIVLTQLIITQHGNNFQSCIPKVNSKISFG